MHRCVQRDVEEEWKKRADAKLKKEKEEEERKKRLKAEAEHMKKVQKMRSKSTLSKSPGKTEVVSPETKVGKKRPAEGETPGKRRQLTLDGAAKTKPVKLLTEKAYPYLIAYISERPEWNIDDLRETLSSILDIPKKLVSGRLGIAGVRRSDWLSWLSAPG